MRSAVALMIELEASFAVSRAEFWKNCGIENWSGPVWSADAGRQRGSCSCRTGADTDAARWEPGAVEYHRTARPRRTRG